MINKKDCETFCEKVNIEGEYMAARKRGKTGTHDGLRLKVVDLRQNRSETRETETQKEGSEGDGGESFIVIGGQDLDCYIVVVPNCVFLGASMSALRISANDYNGRRVLQTTHLFRRGTLLDPLLHGQNIGEVVLLGRLDDDIGGITVVVLLIAVDLLVVV